MLGSHGDQRPKKCALTLNETSPESLQPRGRLMSMCTTANGRHKCKHYESERNWTQLNDGGLRAPA
jgi:hypothetical protein